MVSYWHYRNGHAKLLYTMNPKKLVKSAATLGLIISCLALYGCSSSIGVGVSVGVPIGNHGYISLGSSRWR
jgi:hypothetical protein